MYIGCYLKDCPHKNKILDFLNHLKFGDNFRSSLYGCTKRTPVPEVITYNTHHAHATDNFIVDFHYEALRYL